MKIVDLVIRQFAVVDAQFVDLARKRIAQLRIANGQGCRSREIPGQVVLGDFDIDKLAIEIELQSGGFAGTIVVQRQVKAGGAHALYGT